MPCHGAARFEQDTAHPSSGSTTAAAPLRMAMTWAGVSFTERMACCCCVACSPQGPIPDLAVGDVYGLLIEYSINAQGNMQQALQLVEQMMDRHLSPGYHLSPDALAAVQQVSSWRPARVSCSATCATRLCPDLPLAAACPSFGRKCWAVCAACAGIGSKRRSVAAACWVAGGRRGRVVAAAGAPRWPR